MSNLRSSIPVKNKEFQNQSELVEITDEEFNKLRAKIEFTPAQTAYQVLCFIVFFGILRLIAIFLIALFTCTILLIYKCVLTAFQFTSKNGKYFCLSVARFGIRAILFLCGIVYIKTEGRFDENSRFIISNHIGLLDAFIILIYHNYIPVIDEKIRNVPLIPVLLECFSPIYIDPLKHRRATKMIADVADDFANPPVLVFPEGSPCGHGTSLMRFGKAAFSTPYKVQPITIRHYMFGVPQDWNTFAYQGESIWKYVFRILSMPPSVLSIHFLTVMSMENDAKSNVGQFRKVAQLAMANFIGIRAVNKSNSTEHGDKSD